MLNGIARRIGTALAGLVLLVGAGAPAMAQDASRLDEMVARGKLIVGVSSESPPFGFVDENGQLAGFDVDIAKLIARVTFGSEDAVEFVRQSAAQRWPNAQNGTIDFGAQTTSIYADRALQVGFTRSYIDGGIVMIVRGDSPYQTLEDLNTSDVTLANLTTPTQEERAKRLFPEAQRTTFDGIAAQFNAVKLGRAQAAQLDAPVAAWYVKQNPDMRVIEGTLTGVINPGLFMKPGDFKLWQYLDTVVGEMTGGYLFNDYSAIYEKWFGTKPRNAKWYLNAQN
ncbi:transporter substrate-binding domain-containing protein [Antarcticirhabdus aurantiaca]|uniref:Transporter substrate-binding domain-containing protein n=1 Tax=Antarcticirhabdus aurantiaca TaxID=2606717 RepID=A0ACD4NRS0_9HYPH|nr:transporter substrate-binding domain-containing protein [Antarcticirhabdus aurantiaca]WAJ29403.1 transporter substrate-binding domain-containing protein [Jeongeuplla avenae]